MNKGMAIEFSGHLVWALILLAAMIIITLILSGKINSALPFISSFLKILG